MDAVRSCPRTAAWPGYYGQDNVGGRRAGVHANVLRCTSWGDGWWVAGRGGMGLVGVVDGGVVNGALKTSRLRTKWE